MIAVVHHAVIAPVTRDTHRPKWSVLIPTYNCANYLEDSLKSVLAQDPGPEQMQIIVVDDHSTRDDPEAVVNRIAPDRVSFIRQKEHIGKVRNYESGLQASTGQLIHQLHGDDRVRQGFYESIGKAFDSFPQAGAFFCEAYYINEHGEVTGRTGRIMAQTGLLDNWLEQIVTYQRVQTPSIVLKREVYETVGGFDRRLDAAEDWEMWIRVATRFPFGFLPRPLADYRSSGKNNTARTILAGTRASTMRTLVKIVDQYLPPEVVARVQAKRGRALAEYMLQFVPYLMSKGRLDRVATVSVNALRFNRDPRTCYRLLHSIVRFRKYVAA